MCLAINTYSGHQGFNFELKGGTSLSKGYKIIDRFSEDINIHIKPPPGQNVEENPNKNSARQKESRRTYFDWLTAEIKIDGILSNERDHAFDNINTYRNGGIRLIYKSRTGAITGVKEGILLEAGFDTVTPYTQLTISSWAYDRATTIPGLDIIENRAIDIAYYHPGYTFVEKLQTIATKFRKYRYIFIKLALFLIMTLHVFGLKLVYHQKNEFEVLDNNKWN
jgi:hypothetical protein